jgi:hypothetical protein
MGFASTLNPWYLFCGDYNISTNDYQLLIGENAQSFGRQWTGSIDDVRIYNRALSVDEIKRLYNLGR